jgi:DNA topoisomerase VI subunit B
VRSVGVMISLAPRTTFSTSRLLEFCSQKELTAQTGHEPDAWPFVIIKELVDNALDAAEESGIAPSIRVIVARRRIRVIDNGPGIPPETVTSILDFSTRTSSREAYVAPDRGRQGNACKTVVAMPFALSGEQGRVEIEARGIRHAITFRVDRIAQQPVIAHQQHRLGVASVRTGTSITVYWPDSASQTSRTLAVTFYRWSSASLISIRISRSLPPGLTRDGASG